MKVLHIPHRKSVRPSCSLHNWIITTAFVIIINIIITKYPNNLNSTKHSKFQTDKISIRSFTKFLPFAMTNRTKNGHNRRKCSASLTRLVQCDNCKFITYRKILIILEHLRTYFNVRWFQPSGLWYSCLQILNNSPL